MGIYRILQWEIYRKQRSVFECCNPGPIVLNSKVDKRFYNKKNQQRGWQLIWNTMYMSQLSILIIYNTCASSSTTYDHNKRAIKKLKESHAAPTCNYMCTGMEKMIHMHVHEDMFGYDEYNVLNKPLRICINNNNWRSNTCACTCFLSKATCSTDQVRW